MGSRSRSRSPSGRSKRFYYSAVLPEGLQRTTLQVRSGNATFLEDSITFWVDLTPPRIYGVSPVDQRFAGSTVRVSASVSDNIRLEATSISLKVDSMKIRNFVYSSGKVYYGARLSDGNHTVTLSVRGARRVPSRMVRRRKRRMGSYSRSGCSNSGRVRQTQEKSFVIASWDLLLSMLSPIFIGMLASTIFAKYAPPSLISTVLSPDYAGLVVATMIALPVYLCHGQEVALLRPLMSTSLLGASALPVGHAIAFTMAGTGICASAVPPLVAIVGKRAIWSSYPRSSVALLMGAAINLILQMI